jgi:acetyl-CoA carboxylase biotin carboxyl carrier protein
MPRESAARSAERRVHAEPAPKEGEKGSQRSATATITPDSNPGLMDLEFLRGLIEALDQSGIDWLEIARAGTRIRMSKTPPPAPVADGLARMPMVAAAPTPAPAAPAASGATPAAAPAAAPASKKNLVDVKSPMVGTFYCAPAPEAPPYVEIGTSVRKGQTLCILEAMKLMNELESEVDGVVREILAENADPVEYGQVLFRIEPSGSSSSP